MACLAPKDNGNMLVYIIAYLSTVPAVIVIFPIHIVFPICQIMFFIVCHQVSQGKTIMCTDKVDTMPWSPPSLLGSQNKNNYIVASCPVCATIPNTKKL